MGLDSFFAKRGLSIIAHCILPGAGFLIDAYDLYDTISSLQDVSPSELASIKEDIDSMREGGKEIMVEGKKLQVVKRRCSICRQEGHNKRTCPQR